MAGSPLKRQRKLGIRLEDGSIIAFPYMPRVADLPPGWRHFTTAQKIEHLIGLDRCEEILSWGPITELDPLRFSFQMQVIRLFLKIGVKAQLDGTLAREAARERERERILDQLACREFETSERGIGAGTGKTGPRVGGCENLRTGSETARDFWEYLGAKATLTTRPEFRDTRRKERDRASVTRAIVKEANGFDPWRPARFGRRRRQVMPHSGPPPPARPDRLG
jgi:hypothetical protein